MSEKTPQEEHIELLANIKQLILELENADPEEIIPITQAIVDYLGMLARPQTTESSDDLLEISPISENTLRRLQRVSALYRIDRVRAAILKRNPQMARTIAEQEPTDVEAVDQVTRNEIFNLIEFVSGRLVSMISQTDLSEKEKQTLDAEIRHIVAQDVSPHIILKNLIEYERYLLSEENIKIKAENQRYREINAEQKFKLYCDPETFLPNKARFNKDLEELLLRGLETGAPFSILAIRMKCLDGRNYVRSETLYDGATAMLIEDFTDRLTKFAFRLNLLMQDPNFEFLSAEEEELLLQEIAKEESAATAAIPAPEAGIGAINEEDLPMVEVEALSSEDLETINDKEVVYPEPDGTVTQSKAETQNDPSMRIERVNQLETAHDFFDDNADAQSFLAKRSEPDYGNDMVKRRVGLALAALEKAEQVKIYRFQPNIFLLVARTNKIGQTAISLYEYLSRDCTMDVKIAAALFNKSMLHTAFQTSDSSKIRELIHALPNIIRYTLAKGFRELDRTDCDVGMGSNILRGSRKKGLTETRSIPKFRTDWEKTEWEMNNPIPIFHDSIEWARRLRANSHHFIRETIINQFYPEQLRQKKQKKLR